MLYKYICETCSATMEFTHWRTERFAVCVSCNMPAAIPMWRKDHGLKPCAEELAYWNKEMGRQAPIPTMSNNYLNERSGGGDEPVVKGKSRTTKKPKPEKGKGTKRR